MSEFVLFGKCLGLAATSSSREMIELYLQGDNIKNLCSALVDAAHRGDAEMGPFSLKISNRYVTLAFGLGSFRRHRHAIQRTGNAQP
jgi:hypothetical protein